MAQVLDSVHRKRSRLLSHEQKHVQQNRKGTGLSAGEGIGGKGWQEPGSCMGHGAM